MTDVQQFAARAAIDGAVVAAPTSRHRDLGTTLLQRGIHVFMEKPLAPSPTECEALVVAARKTDSILQVGHVERFNPAWTTMRDRIEEPRFIDATREGPLTFRSMDTGVILDLMIHDIDLILSLVQSQVIAVQALGFNWTGPAEDIAQARLTFANGCVARLSASRVSYEPKRHMRIYGRNWYSEIDFGTRSCYIVDGPSRDDWQSRSYTPEARQRLTGNLFEGVLSQQSLTVPDGNPILDELQDFVTSVATNSTPVVTGHDGLAAVEIAHQVIQRIERRSPAAATYRQPTRRAG